MKKFLLLLAFACATVFIAHPASAQTSAITATHILDVNGGLLSSGKLCYAPTTGYCGTTGSYAYFANVTNGAITPTTFTGGAGHIYILNASSQVIYTYPATATVTLPSAFNFDTFVIPSLAQASINGVARGACAGGAQEIKVDISPNVTYTCTSVNGQLAWQGAAGGAGAPSGQYTGSGAPTFSCMSPCAYVRIDGSPTGQVSGPNNTVAGALYVLPVAMGTVSSAWVATTSTAQLASALNYWSGIMFSQYGPAQIRRLTVHGHYVVPSGQHPTLTSCGSWTLNGYSSDQLIIVSGSPGITSCTVNFRAPQSHQANCTASPLLQSAGPIGTPLTSTDGHSQVFTFSSSQTGFTAHCSGSRY